MRDFLDRVFSMEVENENPDLPFRSCFFRIYDRKIASGEIGFNTIKMDKDAFICLSTAQDPEMSRDDILDLCINMKLTKDEAIQMMCSAGYVLLDK